MKKNKNLRQVTLSYAGYHGTVARGASGSLYGYVCSIGERILYKGKNLEELTEAFKTSITTKILNKRRDNES